MDSWLHLFPGVLGNQIWILANFIQFPTELQIHIPFLWGRKVLAIQTKIPTNRLSSRKRHIGLGNTKVRDLESASRLDFICQRAEVLGQEPCVLLCRGQHIGELDGSKYHQRTRGDGLRNRAETLLGMLTCVPSQLGAASEVSYIHFLTACSSAGLIGLLSIAALLALLSF